MSIEAKAERGRVIVRRRTWDGMDSTSDLTTVDSLTICDAECLIVQLQTAIGNASRQQRELNEARTAKLLEEREKLRARLDEIHRELGPQGVGATHDR
jgi:hypothetical protein